MRAQHRTSLGERNADQPYREHTPGPWQVGNADKEQLLIFALDSDDGSLLPVAQAWCFADSFRCEADANACLIAAAPDILHALEEMVGAAEHCGDGDVPVVIKARSAMEKAALPSGDRTDNTTPAAGA